MAFFREFAAPVKEGQELDVKIEAVGEKGDGIAKVNGFVLFVPGTKVDDEVKIKVTKVLRKVGFAEVIGKASGPVKASEKPVETKEKPEKEKKARAKKEKVAKAGEEAEEAQPAADSEEF